MCEYGVDIIDAFTGCLQINEHLKSRVFMVGNEVTLADLVLLGAVSPAVVSPHIEQHQDIPIHAPTPSQRFPHLFPATSFSERRTIIPEPLSILTA